jgi:transcriptional regulator with XRE-family HTH domain
VEQLSPQAAFVTRLRRYRQRTGISLDEIAAETHVRREHLDAFEQNDLATWPKGLYARAWVRAYASAVGLDPIDTVNEFCRLFPNGDRRVQPTMEEMASIVAAASTYRDEYPAPDRRAGAAAPPKDDTEAVAARAREQVRIATEAVAHLTKTLLARVVGLRPS